MATRKIMIVDDSPTEQQVIVDALKGKGYEITTAADGDEALAKALADTPEVIVLDVIMPGKNGFQVCRTLKANAETQGIKILILSKKTEQADKFWGEKQGADAYMTKPFDAGELRTQVEHLLGPAS